MRKLTEGHDAELFEAKDRALELGRRVRELEGSDIVSAMKKGERVPADVSKEELESLRKGLKEQETYLQAYQADNERLTAEVKGLQSGVRLKEHEMYEENQRLSSKVQQLQAECATLVGRASGSVGDLATRLQVRLDCPKS